MESRSIKAAFTGSALDMANGQYHRKIKKTAPRKRKKSAPPMIETGTTVEEVLGAMWIAHEKYYKPLDKMMSLSLNADGSGEVKIDGVTLCRFSALDALFSWLKV
jgi:hypothetical protein